MQSGSPGTSKGQTLVEFALAAILLFTIVFGIVEASRLIYAYSVVASSAREGARYGAVHPEDVTGIVAVAEERSVGLDNVSVAPVIGSMEIVVTVSHDFTAVVPLIGALLPADGLTLVSTARQYREVVQGVATP